MKTIIAAVAVLSLSGAVAQAADLIVENQPALPDQAVVSGMYAQLLVGAALPGAQSWVEDGEGEGPGEGVWDLDAGIAVAGTLGVNITDGLSAEIDALYTRRAFADYIGSSATISLMGNLKYSFVLGQGSALYVAGGLGYIRETYDDVNNFSGFGYQLIAGASFDLTDHVALVGEYRFQNSFSPLVNEDDPSWTHDVPKHVLLVGAKLSF